MGQIDRIYLNNGWKFTKEFTEEWIKVDYNDSNFEEVRIPHTVCQLPFNYINVSDYEMVAGYRKTFSIGKECEGKTILLTFCGAAHEATVYVNGQEVTVHRCGYTAFTVDISKLVSFDCANVVVVRLDTHENLNQPPFGHVIDYMTYGGIYRDVYVEIKNSIYIEDIYVYTGSDIKEQCEKTTEINEKEIDKILNYEISIAHMVENDCYELHLSLLNQDGSLHAQLDTIPVVAAKHLCNSMNQEGKKSDIQLGCFKGSKLILDAKLWNLDSPELYELQVELVCKETKEVVDVKTIRFGFRRAEFLPDGFYLNGEKVKIRGVNRHQSFPYVGYAMPDSMQITDVEQLKNELGMNAVRTSHYPQAQAFYDRCDEIGLFVFTEIPGWQHLGDETWKDILCEDVKEMVIQYRNHPSIILWGVRVNESQDDDALYSKTNAIAHELDHTRPTGGVRYLKKSSLLEDVYTYNDFLYDGETNPIEKKKDVTPDMKKAYLVSEYNGHMYPTKPFDDEEHRSNHALRHARVLDAIAQADDVAGGFGWCMFDYNTHKDFGSGDSICYHGITDMFRNPKMAAAPYMCFGENVVLEVTSSMDIGEHPAGRVGDVYLYSNADSVKLYKNGEFVKEYPCTGHVPVLIDDLIGDRIEREEGYSHKKAEDIKKVLAAVTKYGMYHLPFSVKATAAKLVLFHHLKFQDAYALYGKYVGDWGNVARSYRFEAIKDGKVVKTVVKEPVQSVHTCVKVSSTHLQEKNTYDVAAVQITMKDQNENVLPFYNEPVSFKVEGDIELIGPDVTVLRGGCGGTYVKTKKSGESTGRGMLTITSGGECIKVEFTIEQ